MSTQGSKRYSGSDHLEVRRQIFHLVLISLWIVPILFMPLPVTLTLMVLIVVINLMVVRKADPVFKLVKPLIDRLEREENLERPGIQALYANLGVLISFLLFGKISAFGVAVLSVGDSLSTLVGRAFGRNPVFFNPAKSWEGTIAFFFGVYLVMLPFLGAERALLLGLVASLVEAVRTGMDDNLTLPVTGSLVVYLVW
ncbi:MAG: SEC59/DGK1/VTE5 family protein [Aquificota bacterium]|nr:SEC59/DGK1/VTE5 family protein [Aquificota bacterium]